MQKIITSGKNNAITQYSNTVLKYRITDYFFLFLVGRNSTSIFDISLKKDVKKGRKKYWASVLTMHRSSTLFLRAFVPVLNGALLEDRTDPPGLGSPSLQASYSCTRMGTVFLGMSAPTRSPSA